MKGHWICLTICYESNHDVNFLCFFFYFSYRHVMKNASMPDDVICKKTQLSEFFLKRKYTNLKRNRFNQSSLWLVYYDIFPLSTVKFYLFKKKKRQASRFKYPNLIVPSGEISFHTCCTISFNYLLISIYHNLITLKWVRTIWRTEHSKCSLSFHPCIFIHTK